MVHAVANVSSLQVAEVIVDAGRMNISGSQDRFLSLLFRRDRN